MLKKCLLAVSTFCAMFVYGQKQIDVYLVGGQSNATGQGYIANLPAAFSIDTTVLIFTSGKPHLNSGAAAYDWLPLRQASESPDRFGPELGFGNAIHQSFPERNIAIIKHAHSGTNLYKDWWPGTNTTDTANWGIQLKFFIETVTLGLDMLRVKGYLPIIRGMLWQQGESDGDKTKEIGDAYGKNLQVFIQRIRAVLNVPDMIFVYGYVLPPPEIYKYGSEVRRGQYLVAEGSGDSLATNGAFVIATEDLSRRATDKNTRYPNDRLHFGTDGTLQLGIRMANKMAATLNLKTH